MSIKFHFHIIMFDFMKFHIIKFDHLYHFNHHIIVFIINYFIYYFHFFILFKINRNILYLYLKIGLPYY